MKSSRLILMVLYFVSLFLYACTSTASSNDTNKNPDSNFIVSLDGSNGSIHKNHEENVNLTPSAVLKFSHIINSDTVNSKNITLTDSTNNPVKIQYDINDAKDMVTLTPDSGLKASTKYQLTITKNLTDANGNKINQTSYDFTTGSESTPIITLISPGDQAKNTSLFPIIRFQITAQMNNDTMNVNNILLTEYGDSTKIGTSDPLFDGSGSGYSKYYFTINNKLSPNTTYELSFNDQITDSSGHKIKLQKFSFTTGTSIAPTVSIMAPKLDEIASRATNIQFAFSKKVNGVTAEHVLLQNDVTKQNVEISDIVNLKPKLLGEVNFQYTFSPKIDLDHNTKYNIIFTKGIVDDEENELKPDTYHFTTGDASNPEIKIIEPNNGKANTSICPEIRIHFSKQVQNISQDTIELRKNSASGSLVPITDITSMNDTDYSFSPRSNLDSDTTYVVIVDRSIISTDTHDPIIGNNTFSFTTGNEVATKVILFSPNNNATDVSITPEIIVDFSREVNGVNNDSLVLVSCKTPTCPSPEPVSGYNIIKDPNNPKRYKITVAKGTKLAENRLHKLSATSQITDNAYTPIAVKDFTFTTGHAVIPKVFIDSSGDQAITDKNIKFHFDLDTMKGIDKNTVQLRKDTLDGRNIDINITADIDNIHYKIQPANAADNLVFSTTYFIIFNSGITDNLGNPLPPQNFNIKTGSEPEPEPVFQKIVGGETHICVLTVKGKIFCWGDNKKGELGDGTTNGTLVPVQVKIANTTFIDIYAGKLQTCAVDDHNQTYCWGDNHKNGTGKIHNAVCQEGDTYCWTPTLTEQPTTAKRLSKFSLAGVTTSPAGACAIGDDRKVYCWGSDLTGIDSYSIFGFKRSNPSGISQVITSDVLPQDISFSDIARAGDYINMPTCALGYDVNRHKDMYCWGSRSLNSTATVKMVIPNGANGWSEIHSNPNNTCALADNGKAYCWYTGAGNSFTIDKSYMIQMPSDVTSFSKISITSDYRSTLYFCGIGNNDNAYCSDKIGDTGDNAQHFTNTHKVTMPNNLKVADIATASLGLNEYMKIGACVITKNFNKIYCWQEYSASITDIHKSTVFNEKPTLVDFTGLL